METSSAEVLRQLRQMARETNSCTEFLLNARVRFSYEQLLGALDAWSPRGGLIKLFDDARCVRNPNLTGQS